MNQSKWRSSSRMGVAVAVTLLTNPVTAVLAVLMLNGMGASIEHLAARRRP